MEFSEITWGDFKGSTLHPEIEAIIGIGPQSRRDVLHFDSAHKTACKIFLTSDKGDIWSKREEVLLYILGKVGAKPNVGETVLYKLLYFIDFNYYEKYEEQLIGATYIKNHHGPTPIEFQSIINEMIENKEIEVVKSKYFQHLQKKYLPHQEPDLSVFNANEIKVIDDVLQKLSGMNASTISEYSHQDVPWMVTSERQKIDYESVFYRTPAYSVREYSNNEIQTH